MTTRYSLDEYAEVMRKNKPYLVALEELVSETNYGTVELTIEVRNKEVEKMTVISRKTWLRPKVGHTQDGFVIAQVGTLRTE